MIIAYGTLRILLNLFMNILWNYIKNCGFEWAHIFSEFGFIQYIYYIFCVNVRHIYECIDNLSHLKNYIKHSLVIGYLL